MPSWNRVIVSGSNATLNSLVVSNGITITGSLLVRTTNAPSIDSSNRVLYSTSTSSSVDWESRALYDGNPIGSGNNLSMTWSNRRLFDTTGVLAANWATRTLLNSSGTTILDWSGTSGTFTGTSSYAIAAATASYVNPLRQTVQITGSLAVTGSTALNGSSTANAGTYTYVAASVGDSGIRIDNSINGYTSINWLSNSMGLGLMAGGGIFAKVSNGAGLHIGQSPNSTYVAPLAVTSHGTTTGTTFLARNSAGTNILKVVDNGRVGINNANPTASLDIAGTTRISGSFNTAASGSVLTVIGSGSAQPIFTVQGSQGELFSVTDSLSGSLYSVNDISGLPILEVFSDNTVLLGNYQDPMLITTTKLITTASGAFTLYALPTSSYDTAFFEYSIRSGSNARAGSIMAIQSGTSVNFTETTTTDFGSTSGFGLTVQVSGANMLLTGSATTTGWTIKTIVRSI